MSEDPAPFIVPAPLEPDAPAPDDAPPIVLLDDIYVRALVGHTVSASEPPRGVYSLTRLVNVEMTAESMPRESAEISIANKVAAWSAEHGDKCPVFMDDAAFAGRKTVEKGKIIRPGGFGPSRLS